MFSDSKTIGPTRAALSRPLSRGNGGVARRFTLATFVVGLLAPILASAQESAPRMLATRLPEIQFADAPLETVIDWLADLTQYNIVVRWERLDELGIERDQPVSLRARNLTLSQVLWLLLGDIGGSDVRLAYRASRGLLLISTADDLDRELITRVYDIRDLLVRPERFSNAPRIEVGPSLGRDGGSNPLQSNDDSVADDADGESATIADELRPTIMSTVEPDSWIEHGGRGRIVIFGGQIIVYNSMLVHQRLAGGIVE